MTKDISVAELVEESMQRVDIICDELGDFATGPRGLFLLNRTKDGGASSEEKRLVRFEFYITEKHFRNALTEMLIIQATLQPHARIYLSVNPRDIFKAVRSLETRFLESHYDPDDKRLDIYVKLLRSTRTAIMQPQNKSDTFFLFDVDNQVDEFGNKQDMRDVALKHLAAIGANIILLKPTKNGWHIVTSPFNPALWDSSIGELKKDALLCIAW